VGQFNFRRAPLPEGRDLPPEEVVAFDLRGISAGYLELLGVPLREGRLLGAGDTREAPPVALVSELAAKRLWPGSSPLGKRFRWSNDDAQKPWITVVGVVGDVVHKPEAKRAAPTIYLSREQNPTRAFYLVARTSGDPTALAKAVTGAFYSIDPNQPLQDVLPLAAVLRQEVSGVKVGSSMMAVFACSPSSSPPSASTASPPPWWCSGRTRSGCASPSAPSAAT
jgi:putative ABC transport system permease protein